MRYSIAGLILACWIAGAVVASEPKPPGAPAGPEARQQVLDLG